MTFGNPVVLAVESYSKELHSYHEFLVHRDNIREWQAVFVVLLY